MMKPCPHALSAALLALPAEDLGVRPPGQPLPPHLPADGLLARQFRHWLRQRDDPGRVLPKQGLRLALAGLPPAEVHAAARRQAALALAGGWDHWIWTVPAASVADLLGLAPADLAAQRRLRAWLQALAEALAPAADAAQQAGGDAACAALLEALAAAPATAPLQAALAREAPPALWGEDAGACFAANRLALLWQGYEAGAALLGHALVAIAAAPPGPLRGWLETLVRGGGAVLNTRRFAQRELQVDGATLAAGSPLLLALSGAADDLGFGAGAHRCPGQDLALESAAAALVWLRERSGRPAWPRVRGWRRLPNADIPCFCAAEDGPR